MPRTLSSPRQLIRDFNYSVQTDEANASSILISADSSFITPCATAFTAILRINIWDLFTSTGTNGRFIGFSGGGANDRNFEMFGDQTDNSFKIRFTDGTASDLQDVMQYLQRDRWVTIGMFYENGVTRGAILNGDRYNVGVPTVVLDMQSKNMYLGAFAGNSGGLSGYIAEFILVDDVMTEAESQLFHRTGDVPSGMNRLIHFTPESFSGSGTTVTDQSGNGNHGTFDNTPVWSTEVPSAPRSLISQPRLPVT